MNRLGTPVILYTFPKYGVIVPNAYNDQRSIPARSGYSRRLANSLEPKPVKSYGCMGVVADVLPSRIPMSCEKPQGSKK
jgi:hypothetical protein